MQTRSQKLRERANQALADAREIKKRLDEADDPSPDDVTSIASKVTDANRLFAEASEADAQDAMLADLESRASTPPGRSAPRPSFDGLGRPPELPHNDERNTRGERHQYSFLKAIRQQADRQLDGLEREVHQELQKVRGRPAAGVYVPTDLPFRAGGIEGVHRRDLDTTAGAGGIPAVVSGAFIDILRKRMMVQQMGATVLTGMIGSFAIPKQTASATAYWVAEGGSPTESAQAVGQVPFAPKTIGAYTDYTRRFAVQTSLDAEAFVRNDLMAVVARGVDLAAIAGSGSSNQPLGILNYGSPVATVPLGANGGPMTWAALIGMETEVASDDADEGTLGYLTNSAVKGQLKSTPKIGTTFPLMLWDDANANTVNGYPIRTSNQVPRNLTKGTSNAVCSAVIFGNWADLVMAFWTGMDVLSDPYTGSTSGTIRVVVLQDVDINVRRGESFSVIKDVTTA